MKPLIIAGREFTSRLFLGTGKFSSNAELSAAIQASGTELVTVALRRVEIGKEGQDEDILAAVPAGVKVMLNTSGARTAEDAVRIGKIARAAGYDWIKLEIHPDPNYLLPDPVETYKAAVELVAMGFTVLPSQTNFLFVSRPGRSGKELLDGLRARGVLVRWWADEPIRDWLRVSIGTDEEMRALVGALKELI